MTDYIRRLVSGNKARYKDDEFELDLVYLTPRLIIMGYPASGLESLYRNPRGEVRKFLESRHGKGFWVWNLCPLRENGYAGKEVFDGRVSRWPWPDHHAPPLTYLPLVAKEIQAWMKGEQGRVAVLHCKAGKGRSGTMACSYLLFEAFSEHSSPAQKLVEEVIAATASSESDTPSEAIPSPSEQSVSSTPVEAQSPKDKDPAQVLKDILDLHTSKRMRSVEGKEKQKQGVSIPSQRRWLGYYAKILHGTCPSYFLSYNPISASTSATVSTSNDRVRLTHIILRMHPPSSLKKNLLKAANTILDRGKEGGGRVWASLARYDDTMVATTEDWIRGGQKGGEEVFKDQDKMVRSFAKVGCSDSGVEEGKGEEKIVTYTLKALSNKSWENIQEEVKGEKEPMGVPEGVPPSAATSVADLTIIPPTTGNGKAQKDSQGVILDANREVRVKLYMGQVFMGWLWLVPSFHMPSDSKERTTLKLTRKEVDFPLGIGKDIVDVEIGFEWVITTKPDGDGEQVSVQEAAPVEPPNREDALSPQGKGNILTSAVQGAASGETTGGIRGVVEATQAVES
ncbi:Telomerase protein component 1 [Paramarasmius palmivorus]|uniref:phosphatidylinositol-3,4,5-trisphosphate 3-phosphatase n=1 Tax=Paramarasmius palmivorus TaxID=297713 RepID=A0AAW0CWH5_9AGAR